MKNTKLGEEVMTTNQEAAAFLVIQVLMAVGAGLWAHSIGCGIFVFFGWTLYLQSKLD